MVAFERGSEGGRGMVLRSVMVHSFMAQNAVTNASVSFQDTNGVLTLSGWGLLKGILLVK